MTERLQSRFRLPHWGWCYRQIARFLYTQNPFYLLSVAFVLHSTRLWYRQSAGPFDPWPLMGIICGYIVLVAAVGFVLVRWGKVWDDARSIFLILLLLFVELSLTFDSVVVSQPATGGALLAIGLTLAAVVSEGLLIGLRIHLPLLYRLPYHLFLALLFLYPLAIVNGLGGDTSAAVWRIYFFSPAAAGVLLTLLPAVRRGAGYVAQTGTRELTRIIHARVGCVEQARAMVRLRSQGRRSVVDSVSSAPKAACADAPLTCASLTHPT